MGTATGLQRSGVPFPASIARRAGSVGVDAYST
jgi:hypothetical protein